MKQLSQTPHAYDVAIDSIMAQVETEVKKVATTKSVQRISQNTLRFHFNNETEYYKALPVAFDVDDCEIYPNEEHLRITIYF